jgi:hypothetical protein
MFREEEPMSQDDDRPGRARRSILQRVVEEFFRDAFYFVIGAVGGGVLGGVVAAIYGFSFGSAVLLGAAAGFFLTIFLVACARGF